MDTEQVDLEICWDQVQTFSDELDDPHFRECEMLIELQGNAGEKQAALRVPVKLERWLNLRITSMNRINHLS